VRFPRRFEEGAEGVEEAAGVAEEAAEEVGGGAEEVEEAAELMMPGNDEYVVSLVFYLPA
jgi:hypothetical protein